MPTTTGSRVFSREGVPVLTYREDGFRNIPSVHLEDAEYGGALRRFIGVCVDIVPINSKRGTICLASRRSKPMTGWWWIGGGMLPNETYPEAAIRSFKRETGIELSCDRLTLRALIDYLWKDRQQEPQTIGCHMQGATFSVELSQEELSRVELDTNEYGSSKLDVFSRKDLVINGVFPAILDVYDLIFPPHKLEPTFGTFRLVHEDERRAIYELDSPTGNFSVNFFKIKVSELPLGKHAHAKKTETFTILSGGGVVLTCPVDQFGNKAGEVAKQELAEGSVVHLPPFTAHTFYLQPGTTMHCFSSEAFDKEDFVQAPFLVL